jgi:hypothetical protein
MDINWGKGLTSFVISNTLEKKIQGTLTQPLPLVKMYRPGKGAFAWLF